MPHSLQVRLLGELRIVRDGESVKLPRSKKTRALLAYLIATGRAHSRERLCALFWDVADDPRAALRWSLTKMRALVDDEAAQRIKTEGEMVSFAPEGAEIDLAQLRDLVGSGQNPSLDELVAFAGRFAGDLLEGVSLPDFHEFSAWQAAAREEARREQARLLTSVIELLEDDAERAVPFSRHRVQVSPSDVGARVQLIQLLAQTDRLKEAEQQYHRGIELVDSDDAVALREAWARLDRRGGARRAVKAPELRQEVRFCSAKDGTSIAYATCGRGPVILKAANWLSHVEYDWDSPLWSHFTRELTQSHTYVRYDDRGSGLSDWEVDTLERDKYVEDLEAVADAVGAERFVLLGISKGASTCVEYIARHPERVAGFVVLGGFAVGWETRARDKGYGTEKMQAMLTLIRTGWGADNPAFRQIFTSLFFPKASLDQIQWFNELQRISATPENAARMRETTGSIDVRERLKDVHVPTLVMHAQNDAVVPHRYGRKLAAGIEGARFVTLEGDNHIVLEDDPGWPKLVEELRGFLVEVEGT